MTSQTDNPRSAAQRGAMQGPMQGPVQGASKGAVRRADDGMPVLESGQLFGPTTEIGIMHHGSLYRLKITRQGKLILNK